MSVGLCVATVGGVSAAGPKNKARNWRDNFTEHHNLEFVGYFLNSDSPVSSCSLWSLTISGHASRFKKKKNIIAK